MRISDWSSDVCSADLDCTVVTSMPGKPHNLGGHKHTIAHVHGLAFLLDEWNDKPTRDALHFYASCQLDRVPRNLPASFRSGCHVISIQKWRGRVLTRHANQRRQADGVDRRMHEVSDVRRNCFCSAQLVCRREVAKQGSALLDDAKRPEWDRKSNRLN